jgi:hypothetical protein
VAHGYFFEHGNFISNLAPDYQSSVASVDKGVMVRFHHMLPSCHQPLVDDFRSVVLTSIDMHALLHDRIGASSQSLAGFISTGLDLWTLAIWWLSCHVDLQSE